MEKYSIITIDKAVGLTGKCLCCNSIMEIVCALNDYNKKMVQIILFKRNINSIQQKVVQIAIYQNLW